MIARAPLADRRPFSLRIVATALPCALLTVFLGCLMVRLAKVAASLRVDYYDSYHLFASARALALSLPAEFDRFRPVGATLLYTPLFTLPAAPGVPFPACHFEALLLFAALLVTLYGLYRRDLPQVPALLAVALFATSPLVIHVAPFCKEDLPATLFTAAAFLALMTGTHPLALIVAAAAAMLTRYNALALLPPLILIFARPRKRGVMLCVTSLLAAFFVMALVDWRLGKSPLGFPSELWTQLQYNRANGYKPALVAFSFLARAMPPPFWIGAAWGMVTVLRDRDRIGRFHAVWLVWFFFVQACLVPGKEARYLLPLYPPLYYLALRGTIGLLQAARLSSPLVAISALGLIIPASRQAYLELGKFSDPTYTTPFAEQVSAEATRVAGDGPLVWAGPFYALHPRAFVYHPWDDFAYLYHFSADGLAFFTRRPVGLIESIRATARADGAIAIAGIGRRVRDGTTLVVNPEPAGYTTGNVPFRLRPLVVERVRIRELSPKVLRHSTDGQYHALVSGISDGRYELYLETSRTALAPVAEVEAFHQTLRFALRPPAEDKSPRIYRLFLLGYDRVRAFPAP